MKKRRRRGPSQRKAVAWNHGLTMECQALLWTLCVQAEGWHEALHNAKKCAGFSEFGKGCSPSWAGEIRCNHRTAWGCLWALFSLTSNDESIANPAAYYAVARRVAQRPNLLQKVIKRGLQMGNDLVLPKKYLDESTKNISKEILQHLMLGIEYLETVWQPCLMIYKKTPTQMRREARAGDLSCIEDYLRADKMARYDKRIASHIESFRLAGNRAAIERINRAENGTLVTRKKDSRVAIKASLGGLALAILAFRGKLVKPICVKRVYDYIARQKKGGWCCDPDIKNYNTFRSQVSLEANRWSETLTVQK